MRGALASWRGPFDNAGLWFDYGLEGFDTKLTGNTDEKRTGGAFKDRLILKTLEAAAAAGRNALYVAAYADHQRRIKQAAATAEVRCRDRLFHGLGESHVMETSVYLHPLYGVPILRDASLKGLTAAYARSLKDERDFFDGHQLAWLFGSEDSAGNLAFHDAWWIPGSTGGNGETGPLVREVETPHHGDYYGSKGSRAATDFDDPIPIPQVAVTGSFLAAIEGPDAEARLALDLLRRALADWGFGGRIFADYGRFTPA